jgi:hypothetical protein
VTAAPQFLRPVPEPIAVEARARLMWGEPVPKVLVFLRSKKVETPEAQALIAAVMQERVDAIRARGRAKAGIGTLLVAAPIAYYFVARLHGVIHAKLFASLLVLGAIGVAQLTQGLSMVFRPRATTGSLSNLQD